MYLLFRRPPMLVYKVRKVIWLAIALTRYRFDSLRFDSWLAIALTVNSQQSTVNSQNMVWNGLKLFDMVWRLFEGWKTPEVGWESSANGVGRSPEPWYPRPPPHTQNPKVGERITYPLKRQSIVNSRSLTFYPISIGVVWLKRRSSGARVCGGCGCQQTIGCGLRP